jgi:2-amino-4-hydroxy-6-hydroxymethyldihydropteridine diphosphokinase
MTTVAVAMGSNLGDRRAHLLFARERLRRLLADARFSSIVETVPEGVPEPQPLFLNAAAVGASDLTASDVLAELQSIERASGRARPSRLAPRTLDLDLILFGDRVIDDADLKVPHPRFRQRRFVLQPLAEIAPTLQDPVTNRTVLELLEQLTGA